MAGSGGSALNGGGGAVAGGSSVALDAGTGLGGADGADDGEFQRCEANGGCLEFRGHSELCQEGNAFNCQSIFNGTYFEGACPLDRFEFAEVEATGCGPTAVFRGIQP